VRIKLDENIPISAAQPLRNAGHDVDTVVDEHLTGADDGDVLRTATAADRLVVTLDRGFGAIRSHPPGSHGGVLVLRCADQSPAAVTRDLEQLLTEVDLEELAGCIVVFRGGELRIRRSPR
jgi:predicted nuclease of predicted toxin-antitoxin system